MLKYHIPVLETQQLKIHLFLTTPSHNEYPSSLLHGVLFLWGGGKEISKSWFLYAVLPPFPCSGKTSDLPELSLSAVLQDHLHQWRWCMDQSCCHHSCVPGALSACGSTLIDRVMDLWAGRGCPVCRCLYAQSVLLHVLWQLGRKSGAGSSLLRLRGAS